MALQAAQEAHGLSVVTRVPGRYGGRALAARAACARQSRDVVAFRLSRNVATMDTMAERKG